MSSVKTVLGTMEICMRAGMEESSKMLNLFRSYGYCELDLRSTLVYSGDKTEVYLGNLKSDISEDFIYATKASAVGGKGLQPERMRDQFETTLKNLKRDQVNIFYLHSPDHETPLMETLKTVNEFYKEGKFKEFGLSNYSAWLTAEVVNLCKKNQWILPTVYQGMYSALTRMVEKELFPCLRYYNIRFYGYSPLGGGFLTGKYKMGDISKNEPGRFFGGGKWPAVFRNRYWHQENFDAVEAIRCALSSAYGEGKVSVAEAAYRWLYHHSALEGKHGDAVIVGAATADQLKQNLDYTKRGPLDENVVSVINNIWEKTSHVCPDYAR